MSGASFLDGHMDDEEIRQAWRSGDLVSSCYGQAPSRDARVLRPTSDDSVILRWLVDNLGAETLLAMVGATEGGTLGQRLWRTQTRQRIEELA